MRNTILTLAPVLLSATLSGQGVFSNKTQSVLEKVIQDYPNHFYHIKGEMITQARQTTEYRSTLQLPGSSSCTITLYRATRDEGYGWTCTILEAGSFESVKEKFREIYGQLTNSIVTTNDQKTYILSGQYEEPVQEKKHTQVVFSLLPGVGEMKKLKVELSLCQAGKGWKIALSVNDQELKEEVQNAITVN
ncbi:MAG TPA: hypothetical protein VNS58_01285 [Puia sp.]|nr:hypothetical protein [Puia sp.]